MSPSEHQKFTRFAPFVVMGMIALVGGTFFTVLTTQQNQDNRTRAAITAGTYNGTLTGDGHIVGGGVTGDIIGSNNTIGSNVEGCIKGNNNIVGGRVFGTVSGTGNAIVGGSGSGPCLSSQTSTSYIIYDDALRSGWVNWAWRSNVNFANTTNVHSGSKAITFTGTSGDAGLYLHSNSDINTSTYTHLSFAAKAASTGKRYYVQFYDSNNTSMAIGAQLANYGGDPTTSSWKTYNIPLSLLNSKSRTISGIAIVDSTGTTQTLYVDDIKLVPAAATAPTVAPTNTPLPPTATPIPQAPTATPVPPTPTVTPTSVPELPTPTLTPSLTPTLTPTGVPTPTDEPTPTPRPTSTPIPTATPEPGSTSVAFTLALHGVGKGGDNANPSGQGNMTLLRPQRAVSVDIYNDANVLLKTVTGTVTFDSVSGHFKGLVSLGTGINTGAYQIRVKADQFLRTLVPGIQNLTSGGTVDLPLTAMVTGDINNDNQLNILDYNIMMGCYSDLSPAVSCPAGDEVRADLTDDGAVNQFDYNLFLRELVNRGGE